MNVRAIIFDVYGTLLEVGPPPADADARWQNLHRDMLHLEPRLSRREFSGASIQVIARRQEAARARGIPWPEIHWPSVVVEIVPELARLARHEQDEFVFRQMQTGHTTRLSAAAAEALRRLKERPNLLGIASNAQAYTVRELKESLAAHGLCLDLFEAGLCFWSFEHGFSKPDPHVFQILAARLAGRGIPPAETLMVGDRLDNDIEPVRAFGWQTWRLTASPAEQGHLAGDWKQLAHRWRNQS